MEYFSIIKDADIFENPTPAPKEYSTRPTAKGIIIDNEGNIAVLSNGEHSLFPGGGVDPGETFEQAMVRECMEEIGCNVEVISSLGAALQYRAQTAKIYEVQFFVANVIGEKGFPTTTQAGELTCTLSWLSEDAVLKLLEEQLNNIPVHDYPANFNCRTHLFAFKKYVNDQKK